MIKKTTIFFFLLITNLMHSQIFYTEDFETDGNNTRYFAEVDVDDPSTENDYFFRTDGTGMNANSHISADYNNISGTYFWAGEDHNDPQVGGSGNEELSIEFNDISIAGKSNIHFTALIGGNSVSFAYDNSDYVIIEYRIDNGAWLEGLSYHQNTASQLSLDTNGDDIGDGFILNDLLESQEFSITETGNEIDLRIRAANNTSNEEWAIDLIQLSENSTLSNLENLFVENDIKVYTIDASGIFQIEASNTLILKTIVVFDLSGKAIISVTNEYYTNNKNINLSNLKASVYILKITTNKGVFTKKVIKK